jgi:hypothetical protein
LAKFLLRLSPYLKVGINPINSTIFTQSRREGYGGRTEGRAYGRTGGRTEVPLYRRIENLYSIERRLKLVEWG